MRFAAMLGAMLASVMPLGQFSAETALLSLPPDEPVPMDGKPRGRKGKGWGVPTRKGALGPGGMVATYHDDQAAITAARRATRYIRRAAAGGYRGRPPAHIREKIILAQGLTRGQ